MELIINPSVQLVFDKYPKLVQQRLLFMRELIIESAESVPGLTQLEETLKWGEPSYLAKQGSTIRIDWKSKTTNQYV